jgi:hypothetical protein
VKLRGKEVAVIDIYIMIGETIYINSPPISTAARLDAGASWPSAIS